MSEPSRSETLSSWMNPVNTEIESLQVVSDFLLYSVILPGLKTSSG